MVQRASNLDARKKTFSNYKHHDTVKFMVSPSLAVNFVSQAWGGRASDKHITLESDDFMNGLSAADCVMADRGFNIGNDLKKEGGEATHTRIQRQRQTSDDVAGSPTLRIHI